MDPYFKKNINFQYRGCELNFCVSQVLFSSQDIDVGTKHLLKTLTDEGFDNYRKVLDLGCGYGPIGISLKSVNPSREVHMVDKDALAINYSRQNAELNNVIDIKIYGSLGYDDVSDSDFDLIVSNIPAKVGDEVLAHMLRDARFHLKPNGKVAVVVIDAIGDYVTEVLKDPNIRVLFHKRWPGHLVFHYQFLRTEDSAEERKYKSFESGSYDRGEKQISINNSIISIKTTYNLPEFDTLSFETELLLHTLEVIKGKTISHAIVFNPGQGFIPVALSKLSRAVKISLIDRDLQALRISKRNLVLNQYPENSIFVFHQVGIAQEKFSESDCIVGVLSEKDSPEVHAMFLREATLQLDDNGVAIFASSSTAITRLVTLVKSEKLLNIVDRQKVRGRSAIILKKRI